MGLKPEGGRALAMEVKVDDFAMPLAFSYVGVGAGDRSELEDAFEDLSALMEDELTSSREQAVEILQGLLDRFDIQRSGIHVRVAPK